MKIQCKKNELDQSLKYITPFLSSKGLRASSFGIKNLDDKFIFSYYNEMMGIGIWAPFEAPVLEPFSKCIDSALFPKIIANFPAEDLTLNFTDRNLQVSNPTNKHKISINYTDDEPEPIIIPMPDSIAITMKGTTLKEALKHGAPFVSNLIVNPVVMMIHIVVDNKNLRYYSTDGTARVAHGFTTTDDVECLKNDDFYIPGAIAEKLGNICSDDEIKIKKPNAITSFLIPYQ